MAWLRFFLEGVRQVAEGAVKTAERLRGLFATDRAKIEGAGRRAGSGLRVYEALKARPTQTITKVVEQTGLSFPASGSAMDLLVSRGIAWELTGNRRNRRFAYSGYLEVLMKETQEA